MGWKKDFAGAKPSTRIFATTIAATPRSEAHPMAHGANETEIKLAVESAQAGRRLLRAAGFTVSRRRVFESNVVFDTPTLALRKASTLLRVRQAGGLSTITYKGRPVIARHKSREELELEIADATTMSSIIERLGLSPVFRYEKYRAEYRQSRGAGMALLDETPVGVYLELEGSPRWIDRTARQLGFSEQDYIVRSYGRLYLEWCRRKKMKPADMVFERGAKTL
jgi:adenylate cyclase class 2